MDRLLVTGGSGLLGSKIVKQAKNGYMVVPTYHAHALFLNSVKLDIANKQEVFKVIQHFKPQIVIHTAAETNVDKCEINKTWAWKANSEGTRNIAEACAKINAKLIYVSTDYVFDGDKGFYVEVDEPNPVNYYGKTKLKGEEFVKTNCKDYVIARASVIYGWHLWKANFTTWVINSLRCCKRIEVVDDHYNSPILADNLAQALLEITKKGLNDTYHTSGSERINRYEFAVKIAKTFHLDTSLIKPIRMSNLKIWVAKRPRDSSLRIDKAQKQLKTRLLNIEESLEIMKENKPE